MAAFDGVARFDADELDLGRCSPSRLASVESILAARLCLSLPVVSSESVSLSESSHRFGYLAIMEEDLVGLGSMVLVSARARPLLSTVKTTEVLDLGKLGVDSEMEAREVVEFRLYLFNGDALL